MPDTICVTHSTSDAALTMGAPSERWLIEQIRSGKFPARKIGRFWRMTDQDIQDALSVCKNRLHDHRPPASLATGLTPRSLKNVQAPR